MQMRGRWGRRGWAGAIGMVLVGVVAGAEPPAAPTGPGDGDRPIGVAVARDRATLLHRVYEASLETIHQRYFRGDRATIPARALEDVFARMAEESRIEARWIAVNTRAMSIDHAPKTAFEKQAAAAIAAGEGAFERVEGGYYRRAGAIPLGSGCIGCHAGFGAPPGPTPRFAGLVISVPLDAE